MHTKEKEFIPVYFDLAAKNLFGTNRNVRFTEDLLEKYFKIPSGTFRGCNIKNSVTLTSEVISGKKMELDIKVELPNKSIVNLEFYSIYVSGSETKSFMYASKIISNELIIGEDYDQAKRIHQINFIHDDHVRKDREVVKRYLVMNMENPHDYILGNYPEIDIINVAIKEKNNYNEINKDFDRWRRFIGASSYEEMMEIAQGVSILEDAMEEVKRFNNNEEVQEYYKINEKLRKSELNAFKKEGIEQGIEQGLEQGSASKQIEIAKNMLKKKMNVQDIIEVTGLSQEELDKLNEELR